MGRAQRSNAVVLLVVATTIVGGSVAAAIIGGYRINLTPSEPLGLWRIVALDRPASAGDLVFICPPQTPVMHEAREAWLSPIRNLPERGRATHQDGNRRRRQQVEISTSVTVDGRPVPFSDLITRDGKGRPMKPYRGGIVPKESVFLHSPFRGSYDSRYFGPYHIRHLGLAQPVLTHAP